MSLAKPEVIATVPELPEVETLRRGLEKSVLDRPIRGVVVANPKVLKEQSETAFRERVVGTWITEVTRRGKYLLLSLSAEKRPLTPDDLPRDSPSDTYNTPAASFFLCIHLKMRGQLLLQPENSTPGPYHCVSLLLDRGETIRFYDMWTWGEIRALTQSERENIAGLAEMAEEPLSNTWNAQILRKRLGKKRIAIKTALLDQKVVAGVGNIYADESLYRAGIHPERQADTLTDAELARLVQEIREVLTEAVGGGGTTSDEYADLSGQAGRYTPRVYDRGGKPCQTCDTPLTRIRLGGRGTVYCERCQPRNTSRP